MDAQNNDLGSQNLVSVNICTQSQDGIFIKQRNVIKLEVGCGWSGRRAVLLEAESTVIQ